MLLPSAYPFMVKQNGGVSWVNDPRSHRMSSLKMSLWIMSTFVKWKFHELIFWTAHFQQLWAHGILSSLFLVKWVYIKKGLYHKVVQIDSHIQAIAVQLTLGGTPITILSVYIPGNNDQRPVKLDQKHKRPDTYHGLLQWTQLHVGQSWCWHPGWNHWEILW